MEYNGFISEVIRRSASILRHGQNRRLEVTALLLLFSAGYVMSYERLKYWVDDDRNLKPSATRNKIKRLAQKIHADDSAKGQQIAEFCKVDLSKWNHYTNGDMVLKKLVFRRDLLPRIVDGSLSSSRSFSLDTAMTHVRNAFAHGGVHPLSHSQMETNYSSDKEGDLRFRQRRHEIERVFFVSEIVKGKGISVFDIPVSELEAFWIAWQSLLIGELGDDGLAELDNAA